MAAISSHSPLVIRGRWDARAARQEG